MIHKDLQGTSCEAQSCSAVVWQERIENGRQGEAPPPTTTTHLVDNDDDAANRRRRRRPKGEREVQGDTSAW